jgi:hypothetical protein
MDRPLDYEEYLRSGTSLATTALGLINGIRQGKLEEKRIAEPVPAQQKNFTAWIVGGVGALVLVLALFFVAKKG